MKILGKIKEFLGLQKRSKYVNEYIDRSNIRSSLYVTSVVMILEIFMMLNITLRQMNIETRRTVQWFVIHMSCFAGLFVASLVLFIISLRHVKHGFTKASDRFAWDTFKYIFSVIAIAFGIYISFLDYKKGEQFKLTATVEPSNHTSTVKWTSSNTKVATVTSNGTVRTKGYGECRITASIDGLEVSCTVTVNKPSTPTQAPTKAPAPPTQAPTQPPTAAPTQAPEPTAQIEEKTDGE